MRRKQDQGLFLKPSQIAAAAGVVAASIFMVSTPVVAHPRAEPPRATAPLVEDALTNPTSAWVRFCDETPAECEVDVSQPESMALTPKAWATLLDVNVWVNSAIVPVTDQEHWGVEDRWDYPDDGLGDCEDIQLLKRRLLVERGFPRRALRMTVVLDETGVGHAVLMVRTDRGDLILDNKTDTVLPWMQTGYTFIKREGSDGRDWVWFEDRHLPLATAAR